jgi:hypothetical protein
MATGLPVDNISKVLAGVIGIAGILAFLTPSEVPFATEQEATQPAPAVAPASEPAPQPEQPSEITDADLVIGQPTIDGNPVVDGNPFGQDPNANVQNVADPAQQQGDNAPPSFQGYTMPQAYGQQQAPQNPDEAPAPL